MTPKTALITGASSGIGAATALELARRGFSVVLVARRYARLQEIAQEIRHGGGQANIITADLSQESECIRIHQQTKASCGGVDVLVNNAGIGWYGFYTNMPWRTAQELLQINIGAVVHLTRLFLPDMQARGNGHIINIGSVSGGLPSQGVAVYGASKSFLDAFTTALHREMQGANVHISVVRAGPVISEFYLHAQERSAGLPIPVERFAIPAERVACAIWKLLKHPRRVIYVPWALGVTPWIEMLFGGLIDRLGPILLRRQSS